MTHSKVAFKTHWKLVFLTPVTSSELCDSGTGCGAFGTHSRRPCTDHLLPGDPGGWTLRESWAPAGALTSNLGQRPAHVDSGHPPSRPDWLLGPWGPLRGRERSQHQQSSRKAPAKVPDQTQRGAGVPPSGPARWAHDWKPVFACGLLVVWDLRSTCKAYRG